MPGRELGLLCVRQVSPFVTNVGVYVCAAPLSTNTLASYSRYWWQCSLLLSPLPPLSFLRGLCLFLPCAEPPHFSGTGDAGMVGKFTERRAYSGRMLLGREVALPGLPLFLGVPLFSTGVFRVTTRFLQGAVGATAGATPAVSASSPSASLPL